MIRVEVTKATADIEIDMGLDDTFQREYAVLVVAVTDQIASMLKVTPVDLLEAVLDLMKETDSEDGRDNEE